jgi:hypothetical protein
MVATTDQHPSPEFSRPVSVEKLIAGGSIYRIEANPAEREALARRFGILGVGELSAELTLRSSGAKGIVRLEGEFVAQVRQSCVVTLAEVAARIDEHFNRAYAPEAVDEMDVIVDLDAADPPDPLTDGIVDIGEATAEALALALDPYPRSPGAVFDPSVAGVAEPPSPFAALAALKRPR